MTSRKTTTAKPRKLVTRIAPNRKATGFAIGVSQEHYWIITALARARNNNRQGVLGEIIEQHARATLSQKDAA